jgi:aspartate 1-decarboxylase
MKYLSLKSMILKANVTMADVQYVGSITIDEDLMDKANLSENENVMVVDRTNGARLETYVIRGDRGSGVVAMNGAAAHLIKEGDEVDVLSFTWLSESIEPLLIKVDRYNRFAGYGNFGH